MAEETKPPVPVQTLPAQSISTPTVSSVPPTPQPSVPATPPFSEKSKEWFANNRQNVLAYAILILMVVGIPAWWHYGESYRQVKLAGENTIEIDAYGGPDASWDPYNLELKSGTKYTLKITSHDVTHKFSLPEKQIDVFVEPGHPVEVELFFEQPGTYYFRCMSWCGLGHQTMVGKIEVT